MAWGGQLLSSGSRDRCVLQRDVRAPEPCVAKLVGHRSEVCGLKVRDARGVMRAGAGGWGKGALHCRQNQMASPSNPIMECA